VPDLVVGPGHNSVIRGPNNRELYCVYHRWTGNGRVLAIDRMDFAGPRVFIKGATTTPQIAPYKPAFADFFDGETFDKSWQSAGDWRVSDNEIINESGEENRLLLAGAKTESFLCEFYLRAVETVNEKSRFGFCLLDEAAEIFEFLILPDSKQAAVYYAENGEIRAEIFSLPEDFNAAAFHLLRVETDAGFVKIALDEANFRFEKILGKSANRIALAAENMRGGFSAFSLTEGFEDLFDWQDSDIERRGWQKLTEAGDCRVENGALLLSNKGDSDAVLTKGAALEDFELAVNVRRSENSGAGGAFGFLILSEKAEEIYRFTLEGEPGNYYFSTDGDLQKFSLPESFMPENYHQFRFLKLNAQIFLQLEELELGAISLTDEKTKIALFCRNSSVAFEAVRLTVL